MSKSELCEKLTEKDVEIAELKNQVRKNKKIAEDSRYTSQ